MSNSDPARCMRPVYVFPNLQLCSSESGEPVPTAVSYFCSWLAGVSSAVVTHMPQGLTFLLLTILCSPQQGCNTWLQSVFLLSQTWPLDLPNALVGLIESSTFFIIINSTTPYSGWELHTVLTMESVEYNITRHSYRIWSYSVFTQHYSAIIMHHHKNYKHVSGLKIKKNSPPKMSSWNLTLSNQDTNPCVKYIFFI